MGVNVHKLRSSVKSFNEYPNIRVQCLLYNNVQLLHQHRAYTYTYFSMCILLMLK